MRVDWHGTVFALSSVVSEGSFRLIRNMAWVMNSAIVLIGIVLVAIFIQRKEIKRRIVLLWVLVCAQSGVSFLSELFGQSDSLYTVQTGIIFATTLAILCFLTGGPGPEV
jgi:hypothetical protein